MNERRLHTFPRLRLLNVANCFIGSAAILFVRACLTASFCGFMPRYARSSLACDAGAIKANGPLCVTFAKGSWQRDASLRRAEVGIYCCCCCCSVHRRSASTTDGSTCLAGIEQ